MERFALLKNLFLMVVADQSVTRPELELLSDRAVQWGFATSDFRAALDYAYSPTAELVVPPNPEDRRELLEELLRVMAADGHLAEQEKDLFAVAAATMEFSGEEVDALIDRVLADET